MKFEDLKFEKWRKAPSYYEPLQRVVLGKRAKVDFPNGYTVSVILGHEDDDSYSNGVNTFEVGVFDRFTGEGLDIIGDGGVKKYATKPEVEYILSTVETLSNDNHINTVNIVDCDFQQITQETADSMLNRLQKLQEIVKSNKL